MLSPLLGIQIKLSTHPIPKVLGRHDGQSQPSFEWDTLLHNSMPCFNYACTLKFDEIRDSICFACSATLPLPSSSSFSLTTSASQVDLVEIKKAFLERYHKTLYKMIEGDTSGDYRRLLLAIVGRDV